MKYSYFLLVILFVSCATREKHIPHERTPAQAEATNMVKARLSYWEPVLENENDVFYGDPLIGLFINSERPVAYDLIKEAKYTIDIEIYEMKDPLFREYLVDAIKSRNVKVRIVKDSNTVGDSCNELEAVTAEDGVDCKAEKEYITLLKSLGAEYTWFDKKELCGIEGRSCFQHGKMIITDNKYLLLSTGNFNSSSFCNLSAGVDKCNRDYSYVTKNRDVIDDLRRVWTLDQEKKNWDFKQVISETHPGLTISPQSNLRLMSLLKTASNSIWIQNQYLEDPAINQVIMEKAREGVEVKVQVAAFCNFGEPSVNKKDKTEKIYSEFDSAGVKSKVFHSKMNINGKPGYLHAKAILIDEEIGWIGSINGSETSTTQNREFGIIFEDKIEVDKLKKIVKEDFNHPLAMEWKDALDCSKVPATPQQEP